MKWKHNGREIQNVIDENVAYALSDEEAKVICAAHNMVCDDLVSRQLIEQRADGVVCKRCCINTTAKTYYIPSSYEPVCDECLTQEERDVAEFRKAAL